MLNENTEQLVQGELVSMLIDNQPDAVMWFIPVFEDGDADNPVDFKAGYCNNAASYILKSPKEQIIGTTLSETPLLDESSRKSVFAQCREVWATGNSLEFVYYNPALNRHLYTQRTKLHGGILNVTRDHSQLMALKSEREKQSEFLQNLISHSPYGISLYESMRDANGQITDFRLKLYNQKSADITAFSVEELYKYTVKELMLIRGHSNYFEMCCNVVNTGTPVYTEYFAQARNQWVGFSIVKFDDGYLLNYIDITETKKLEQQARQQKDMLESVLNASVAGLFALQAITGFSGKVLDFRFTMLNKAAELLLNFGENDRGKTLLQLLPAAKTNGLFEIYCEVVRSGQPVSTNIEYTGRELKGNYHISVSRMSENTVVQSFVEIR